MPSAIEEPNSNAAPGGDSAAHVDRVLPLLSGQRFQYTGTAAEVIDRLQSLRHVDALYTQKEKFWERCIWWSVPLFFLALFSAFVTAGMGLWVAVPMFFLMVLCITMRIVRGRHNFPDRRYRIAERLLQHLKADIPPNAPVSVALDFRHYHTRRLRTNAQSMGFFSGIKVLNYEVPWLTMSSQLYDGSKFRFKIVQCVKRKEKAKRKRTKVTETFRDKYTLSLAVKPTRYPGLAKFESVIKTATPPQGLSAPHGKLLGNRVSVQSLTRPQRNTSLVNVDLERFQDAHSALQLFLCCYHGLGQCRQA